MDSCYHQNLVPRNQQGALAPNAGVVHLEVALALTCSIHSLLFWSITGSLLEVGQVPKLSMEARCNRGL